ncbi:hypothetical protein AAMO2058_001433400 [Amorphochlora amoebiformis]
MAPDPWPALILLLLLVPSSAQPPPETDSPLPRSGKSASGWLESAFSETKALPPPPATVSKNSRYPMVRSKFHSKREEFSKALKEGFIALKTLACVTANFFKPSSSSIVYGLTTTLFGFLAWRVWTKRLGDNGILRRFLLHATVSGLAITLASTNTMNKVGLLGKGANGLIPWWSYIAFAPFHLLYQLRLHTRRALMSEPLASSDFRGVWHIGGWPSDGKRLPPMVQSVIDCTCELPREFTVGRKSMVKEYLCVPLWDAMGPTINQLDHAARWAVSQRSLNRSVLIHCAHGHGRSATVLCAALVASGEARSCLGALRTIKQYRPRARLNSAQSAALRAWADRYAHAWDEEK